MNFKAVEVPVLHARNLRKNIDSRVVLDDVSLHISPDEVVCVIGPSGAGKTTLLRCLDLLLPIEGVQIELFGKVIAEVACESLKQSGRVASRDTNHMRLHVAAELYRREIGFVFQEFNLWDDRSVLANMIEGPIHALKLPRRLAIPEAIELLDRFGLGAFAERRPSQLSGGQRQRVALARALAMRPKVLLLDEITSALDVEIVGEVLDMLRELARSGLPMLIVTHHLEFARSLAHRIVVLAEGRVIEEGPANEVLEDPKEVRTRAFISRILNAR